jgi:Calcineurin-like phosphoesterase
MSKGANSCADKEVWTPVSAKVPKKTSLSLKTIDPDEHKSISNAGRMSFHMTGCSGNYDDTTNTAAVATAMITQGGSSFLYHLGDITYVEPKVKTDDDQRTMYNRQFLAPYSKYPKGIVAIAGNHDGKNGGSAKTSAIHNFLANFCANPKNWPKKWPANTVDSRPAMIQPYPYWRFNTPLAYFIGLYANISNGGILDDPSTYKNYRKGPQYQWLVAQLKKVKKKNETNSPKRAVLVTVHHPPYSGATNFNVRGDPQQGETPKEKHAPYLAVALQQAFSDAGQRADALFSAHAHVFERLTYTYADSTIMPCLIVGCGGHSLENLFDKCDGSKGRKQKVPFSAVTPGSFSFPHGEKARVEAYEDEKKGASYGFLQVTIENRVLTCTFYYASGAAGDAFSLDLDRRQYVKT